MGLAALFGDIPEVNIKKTKPQKDNVCCKSICKEINESIEYHVEQIDDVLAEYGVKGKTYINSLEVQSEVNDDRIAVKTLQNLKHEFIKQKICFCK